MRIPPRWILVVSIATGAAILGDSLLYAVLPVIWEDLGLTAGMVGVILSLNRFVRILTNPVAGWVVGRVGSRLPFVIAVIVAAASTLAYGLGLGVAVFLIARALWGLCWSFLRLGGFLAAIEEGVDGHRGYYIGFFHGVYRVGSLIAVVIGAFLTDLISFEFTIYLFTGITVIAGLLTVREWRNAPPESVSVALSESKPANEVGSPSETVTEKWYLAIGAVFVLAFLHGGAIGGLVTSTLGYLVADRYGDSVDMVFVTIGAASFTGLLLGSRFLADSLWGPVAGHVSDRWGRTSFFTIVALTQVVMLATLAALPLLLWTIIAAVVLFIAATAVEVSLDASAGDLAIHGNRARIMSWYASARDLGAAIGPIVGYSIGVALGLEVVYPLTAGVFLIAAVIFIFLQRAQRSWGEPRQTA